MFCSQKTYRVDNGIDACVGDRVTVAIEAGSVRRVANLAYGIPLLATIAGAAVGMHLAGDAGSMLGAALALALAVVYVRFRSQDGSGKYAARPHIISRS